MCNLGDFLRSPPSELIFRVLLCVGWPAVASPPSEFGVGGLVAGADGSPSELGPGRMPGVLFRVWRWWVRGVIRRLAGAVGSVELGALVGSFVGIRSVSV